MKKLFRPGLIIFSGICLLVSCAKEYSLETGSGGTPATGVLVKDDNGNCLPTTIHGTYNAGEAATDSNYVEMTVTITKPGSYYISTDQQNGLSFADSGYFSVVGTHTLKLGAIGTPILPITTDFTVLFDTSACAFSVNISDGTSQTDPNKSDSAWFFNVGAQAFHGPVDSAYFSTDGSGNNLFTITGYTKTTQDTVFGSVMLLTTARTIAAGNSYNTSANTADFHYLDYTAASTPVYIYKANSTDGGSLTFTITSYDNTTRVAQGTISGTAINAGGTTTNITNGKFKVRISTK